MRLAAVYAAVVLYLLMAVSAEATDHPPADLSLEYGFNYITNGDGLSMPIGVAVSLGVNVSGQFALAVDGRWNQKREDSATLTLTSFQAGPRLVIRKVGATPYVQVVAGAARASNGGSETRFSVMPGAGVDMKMTDKVSIRIGADYRHVFLEGYDEGDLLAHAGVVFQLGK